MLVKEIQFQKDAVISVISAFKENYFVCIQFDHFSKLD
jgi:hypothetical protein